MPHRKLKVQKTAFYHCCFGACVSSHQVTCLRQKRILRDTTGEACELWLSDALLKKDSNIRILFTAAARFQDARQMQKVFVRHGEACCEIDWMAVEAVPLVHFKAKLSEWSGVDPDRIEIYCVGTLLQGDSVALNRFPWAMAGALFEMVVAEGVSRSEA